MNAGTYGVVSIDSVIAGVKMALDLESVTDYDDKIEFYVNEAAGEIDSNRLYVKKPILLDIVNGKAKLPKGFSEIIAIKLFGHEDHNFDFSFNLEDIDSFNIDDVPRRNTISTDPNGWNRELIYMPKKFLGDCHGAYQFPRETVEIDNGYLWFSHPNNCTKVLLSYSGTHCDEYGIFIVYSDWAHAMREYATYKMLQTRPQLWNREFFQYYSKTKEDHYQEYVAAKEKIISKDAKREFEENKYMIKRIYQAYQWNRNKRW